MARDLEGKVAVVTGAASGIGLASAEAMLAAGARVVTADRDEAALKALHGRHGDTVIPLAVDLLDPKECASLVPRALEATGQIDILHANAGTYVCGDLIDADTAAIDRMLNLNVNVVVKNVHDVLPHMIGRKTGDVIVDELARGALPDAVGAGLCLVQMGDQRLCPDRAPAGVQARRPGRGDFPRTRDHRAARRLAAGEAEGAQGPGKPAGGERSGQCGHVHADPAARHDDPRRGDDAHQLRPLADPEPMRALVKERPDPGLWLVDQPVPEIGPDDVLVKIRKTGICGTDVHIFNWDEWAQKTIPTPMTIGHEYAGEIAAVGADVKRLKVGQRVSGEGHVIGMRSRAARGGRYHLDPETQGIGVNIAGAFADYVRVPAFNIVPLPDAIDDELGAILDPLGNAVHTALTYDLVGEDVLITGAGPIGIMAGAVARHVGARHVVITDVNPKRLALAAEVADVLPVDVSKEDLKAIMARLGMTEGFDVALEMSGAPAAFDQLFDSIVTGGRVALLGLPARPTMVDWNKVIFKQLTLKGIYGREMFETWHKMIAMLESGLAVRNVITHRLPAADFLEGFEIMRRGDSGKIVLDWT